MGLELRGLVAHLLSRAAVASDPGKAARLRVQAADLFDRITRMEELEAAERPAKRRRRSSPRSNTARPRKRPSRH